jgi:uncharacterized DUF497 family protein
VSRFDWDEVKADTNVRKHGITFAEADDAASDPLAVEEVDPTHSGYEQRVIVTGWSPMGRLIVVIVSLSGRNPRIISARRATKRERHAYETRS